MTRKYIDCREFPSDAKCTVAIAADNESELLEAAVEHAVRVHHHEDSAALRTQLRQMFKDGSPPEFLPPGAGAFASSDKKTGARA